MPYTNFLADKSGRKFAPKAPPRRAPPAAANSTRASVSDGRPSATPVPETQKAQAPPVVASSPDTPQPVQVTEEPRIEDAIVSSTSATPISRPVASVTPITETTRPTSHEGSVVPEGPVPVSAPTQSRRERASNAPQTQVPGVEAITASNTTIPTVEASIQALAQVAAAESNPTPIAQPTSRIAAPRERMNRTENIFDVNTATATSGESTPQKITTPKPRASQSKRRKSTTSENTPGTESANPRKPRGKRKREPTPEESENVEIAPTVVKMSELCKDLRTGKKSRREIELRNLEQQETERKEKAREKARNAGTPVKPDAENGSSAPTVNTTPTKTNLPRMRIVNGEIVVDKDSLEIVQHADAARELGEGEDVVESRLNRKINQATYGKRTKAVSWDEELTDLFYRGLRMFGTDFESISKMFPGRNRRQIKLKFNNEERKDPERIKRTLLGPSELFDIQTYSELTNTVYEDPEVIQRELDEDKKRIEEQHEREKRAQDELMHNPSGLVNDKNVVPSIETTSVKKRRSISKSISA
ncbi:uncharacterized protein BHQ10_008117 [Talaromyces amestolkiae]|uniref:Myb-like domain-containing protein n=1 Tax=Talaromyces amestolkiae TaxID=1196081 RepID=A0A364L8G8_TALAM|nr:uncharacterized protein BHQ10_008117 [Talaromyces amestolkiae]RAO72105.1 hypothetical protein BHQ10_008117 [Talaromyces amestolkiae]